MKTTKLFTILRTFSADELKQFEKFIGSSYNNPGRNVLPLFKLIKKFHPVYPVEKLTDEKLYRLLYRKGKNSENKGYIKVLLSHLTRLAADYLLNLNNQKEYAKNFSAVNNLKSLNNRKLDSLFSSQHKALEKSINGKIDQDSSMFLLKMMLEKEYCNYLLDREKQQKTSEVLLRQTEYLLFYFLTELFKNRAHYKTNEYVFNAEYDGTLLKSVMDNFNFEPVLERLKRNDNKNYPVLAIYYNSMMAQLDIDNDNYLHNFRKLLYENLKIFDKVELVSLFVDLEACCWKRLNSNISEERRDIIRRLLFNIYKSELKFRVYKDENEYLKIHKFRNIIMAALNLKEYDWLEDFTKKYYKELAPENRDNLYNYSLAVINFNRGKFEEALKQFSKIEYDYFYLKVDVKNWMLLIYYELNLQDQANSLIDSYKHFLAKNKNLSELFRKNNLDFLNCYIKLLKHKNGQDTLDLKKLKKSVSESRKFIHKGWILKKIDELAQ